MHRPHAAPGGGSPRGAGPGRCSAAGGSGVQQGQCARVACMAPLFRPAAPTNESDQRNLLPPVPLLQRNALQALLSLLACACTAPVLSYVERLLESGGGKYDLLTSPCHPGALGAAVAISWGPLQVRFREGAPLERASVGRARLFAQAARSCDVPLPAGASMRASPPPPAGARRLGMCAAAP